MYSQVFPTKCSRKSMNNDQYVPTSLKSWVPNPEGLAIHLLIGKQIQCMFLFIIGSACAKQIFG